MGFGVFFGTFCTSKMYPGVRGAEPPKVAFPPTRRRVNQPFGAGQAPQNQSLGPGRPLRKSHLLLNK